MSDEKKIDESIRNLDLKKKQLEITKLEKENIKLDVEKEKIQLEKNELEKAWYKKRTWWGTIVTLLIGVAGVYVAFSTNIIGVQKLEKQKDGLNETIKNQRDSAFLMSALIKQQQDPINVSSYKLQLLTKAFDSAKITTKLQYELQLKIATSKEKERLFENSYRIYQGGTDEDKPKGIDGIRLKRRLDSVKARISVFETLLNKIKVK